MKQNLQKLINDAGAGHRPSAPQRKPSQGTCKAFQAEGMRANPDGTVTAHDGGNHDRGQPGRNEVNR